MSAPVKTWASLPANAATDAALRVAAAGILGWKQHPQYGFDWLDADGVVMRRRHGWNPDRNRDDLARVFAAQAVTEMVHRDPMFHSAELAWSMARTNPRAALCALLDLLAVPVPQGVHHE